MEDEKEQDPMWHFYVIDEDEDYETLDDDDPYQELDFEE